jgi:hypothetical protein
VLNVGEGGLTLDGEGHGVSGPLLNQQRRARRASAGSKRTGPPAASHLVVIDGVGRTDDKGLVCVAIDPGGEVLVQLARPFADNGAADSVAKAVEQVGFPPRLGGRAVKMWIELKEENYNSAWDSLVDAQSYASMSMQAHETNGHLENYIRRLEVLEKVLFPPQLFFSDRSVISESTCSICGKSMDDCEHIKGKFYLGKQCYEVIKKIETIYAYDIVKDPANKKCRALTFSENGNDTDLMTYRQNDFG